MSPATAGRAREYQVRDHLIDLGWERVMRAAADRAALEAATTKETTHA